MIEAFIAETYVQLATTEAMCYSTSRSYCSAREPTGRFLMATVPDADPLLTLALYCAVPYIAACVGISRMVFRDRSVLNLPGKALILVAKLLNKF